jgi:hypothetical protein
MSRAVGIMAADGGSRPTETDPVPDRDTLLTLPDERLLSLCLQETYRSSGPGGQHRNKTDSAVRLTLRGTGVVVTATERRSQHENRRRALARLRQAIALEVREAVVPGSAPSALLASSVADPAWPRLSQKSDAYLVAAAQVLDRLEAAQGKVSDAAHGLGVSTASLVKFLSLDDRLWERANRLRRRFGESPLR